MTRFSFLLFNGLLVAAIYGLVWFEGSKDTAVVYALYYFSGPYIALTILMAIATTIRWYVSPDEDIIRSAITYWHATWITGLLTFAAIKLLGSAHAGIFNGLGKIFGH